MTQPLGEVSHHLAELPEGGQGLPARQALIADLFGPASSVDGRYLKTKDVALLFQVSERAVAEWARAGKIPCIQTPGGHRRYPAGSVVALLRAGQREGTAKG